MRTGPIVKNQNDATEQRKRKAAEYALGEKLATAVGNLSLDGNLYYKYVLKMCFSKKFATI